MNALVSPAASTEFCGELPCKRALVIGEVSESTGSAELEGYWNHTTYSGVVQNTMESRKGNAAGIGGTQFTYDSFLIFFFLPRASVLFIINLGFSFMFFIHLWKINFN